MCGPLHLRVAPKDALCEELVFPCKLTLGEHAADCLARQAELSQDTSWRDGKVLSWHSAALISLRCWFIGVTVLSRVGHDVVDVHAQTHRTQLATGNPSGRAEWNYRCCFALEMPAIYDDIKVSSGCRMGLQGIALILDRRALNLWGLPAKEHACSRPVFWYCMSL